MPTSTKARDSVQAAISSGRTWAPTAAAVAILAYWLLALILDPLSRLIVEGTGVLPLVGLRVPWAVLLLVLPAIGLIVVVAAGFVGSHAVPRAKSGRANSLVEKLRPSVLIGLILLLAFNYWDGLRLHDRSLAYSCGILLVAGTLAAFWRSLGPRGRGGRRGRVVLRIALVLCLVVEALLIPVSVRLAEWGRYEGLLLRLVYLRPFMRPLLAPDVSGIDLSTRGIGASGLGRGLGGPPGAKLQLLRAEGTTARGLNFRLARLGASVFDFANIEGADFSWADVTQMTLNHARAAGADFSYAFMVGTQVNGGGDFRGARFRRAFMNYSKWNGIDARESDWTGVNFYKRPGYFCGSDFRGAIFRDANLAELVLMETNFSGADFRGASLRGAKLWRSVFHDANLEGADLRGTDAEVEQLGRAKTLYGAQLDPPLAEAIRKKYPRLFEKPDDLLLR